MNEEVLAHWGLSRQKQANKQTYLSMKSCHIVQGTNKTTVTFCQAILLYVYSGADTFLARPTSRCILFDGENISFDASLVIYINSTYIPPIIFINRIHETQNLLSLQLVSFLVELRTYKNPCSSLVTGTVVKFTSTKFNSLTFSVLTLCL